MTELALSLDAFAERYLRPTAESVLTKQCRKLGLTDAQIAVLARLSNVDPVLVAEFLWGEVQD